MTNWIRRAFWMIGILTCSVSSLYGQEGGVPSDVSLDGEWEFCYRPALDMVTEGELKTEPVPVMPGYGDFAISLAVPGFWDEQFDVIRRGPWKKNMAFNPKYRPARYPTLNNRTMDASYENLMGVGWYRKKVEIPAEWSGSLVTLTVGGVRTEGFVYVNGSYAGTHVGYITPFAVDVTGLLHFGKTNEILLAVSNLHRVMSGFDTRGYQREGGGISGSVKLHCSGGAGKAERLFIRPMKGLKTLRWSVDLFSQAGTGTKTSVEWTIRELDGRVVKAGLAEVPALDAGESHAAVWDHDSEGIVLWSDTQPHLYRAEAVWKDAEGRVLDRVEQKTGFRRFEQAGKKIYLNGKSVYLRGYHDMYEYAPNLYPELSAEFFKKYVGRMKEIGYNRARFHTFVPPQEYMEAADELGMILQVELPTYFPKDLQGLAFWRDIVTWSRRHPSVGIYCAGNEQLINERMMVFFEDMYQVAKELDPGCLVAPMECWRGILVRANLMPAPGYLTELAKSMPEAMPSGPDLLEMMPPFQHLLLKRAARCADFITDNALHEFSYANLLGRDWREQEPLYAKLPLAYSYHELGILGCYINLDLEERYTGSIPNDLYESVRLNLTQANRLGMAKRYYENSCRWQSMARKYIIENARKCDSLIGYDNLSGWDQQKHRSGYNCGTLNDFLELKFGDTVEGILQYNGESAALLDHGRKFVYQAGEGFERPVRVALYGDHAVKNGTLSWKLLDSQCVVKEGQLEGVNIPCGQVSEAGRIAFSWPASGEAKQLVLAVEIKGSGYSVANQWNFWVFPPREAFAIEAGADQACMKLLSGRYPKVHAMADADRLRIVSELSERDLDYLKKGGDVVLLGSKPFPTRLTTFDLGTAGRPNADLATIINHHPVLKGIPHEGFCDWQFEKVLEGGRCVVFNQLAIGFDPILEIVSSYKDLRWQGNLWEVQTEGGKLFVASCHFDLADPVSQRLLDNIFRHVTSRAFSPKTKISIDEALRPLFSEEGKNIVESLDDEI